MKRARAIIQYRGSPRIDVCVCRSRSQSGLSRSLCEGRDAKSRGGDSSVEAEWRSLRVVVPVSGDDVFAVASKFLVRQFLQLIFRHGIGIGTIDSADKFIEIRAGNEWNIC